MTWRVTFIRDGAPWSVAAFDIDSLGGAGTVGMMQLVLSADGEEAIISSTGYSPVVQAISTTTGATLWEHDAYPLDNNNRVGELVGSPRAGRYLWRSTSHMVDPITSQLNLGTWAFAAFSIDPALYEVHDVNITVWADYLGTIVGELYFGPTEEAGYGIHASTNWTGDIYTKTDGIDQQFGNLALNQDSFEQIDENTGLWHCHCNFFGIDPAISTPPQSGATAALEVSANYGYTTGNWTIVAAEMTVTFTATGDAVPADIELRDQDGTVLDVINDPHWSAQQKWVALQPDMNAYVRFLPTQGPG